MAPRKFLKGAAVVGGVAAASAVVFKYVKQAGVTSGESQTAAPAISQGIKELKVVTTWPKNFPGLGTGANNLAKLITEMSGGRLEVKVYGAGELVPAFEIFDAVSRGTAQMGHGASYYWKGKERGGIVLLHHAFRHDRP